MSTFRYRLRGASADELDDFVEAGSGATLELLARAPWTEITLVDDGREPDLDEFMANLGYVPDATGPIVVATSDHVVGTESIVLVDATAGPVQVTIPASSSRVGDELVVMKTDSSSNAVTVVAAGGGTIEGQALQTFSMQGQTVRVLGDEATANWHVVSSRRAQDIVFDNSGTDIPGTTVQTAISQIVAQDLTSIETFVAGEGLSTGDLVALSTSGQVVRANSSIAGNSWRVVGVVRASVLVGAPVQVFTKFGTSTVVGFGSAPAASSNGRLVFLNSTAGQAVLVPPTSSGNSVFSVGILQGADGSTSTPLVIFRPQLIALRA